MKLQKIKKISSILFIIIAILTIFEFIFIKGLFTAPIMILAVLVIGLVTIVVELLDKQYFTALHYLITSIALCMGYIPLMAL